MSKHALWRLQAVREKGIQSVAVVLKNSYLFPDHERQVGELASELGFSQVPQHTVQSPDMMISADWVSYLRSHGSPCLRHAQTACTPNAGALAGADHTDDKRSATEPVNRRQNGGHLRLHMCRSACPAR